MGYKTKMGNKWITKQYYCSAFSFGHFWGELLLIILVLILILFHTHASDLVAKYMCSKKSSVSGLIGKISLIFSLWAVKIFVLSNIFITITKILVLILKRLDNNLNKATTYIIKKDKMYYLERTIKIKAHHNMHSRPVWAGCVSSCVILYKM